MPRSAKNFERNLRGERPMINQKCTKCKGRLERLYARPDKSFISSGLLFCVSCNIVFEERLMELSFIKLGLNKKEKEVVRKK